MSPPVPADGLGTMDPSRHSTRRPERPLQVPFVPPQRPPHARTGYCPRGHPGAWQSTTRSESYCPVCGLPGDWAPSEACPHSVRQVRSREVRCGICDAFLGGVSHPFAPRGDGGL